MGRKVKGRGVRGDRIPSAGSRGGALATGGRRVALKKKAPARGRGLGVG